MWKYRMFGLIIRLRVVGFHCGKKVVVIDKGGCHVAELFSYIELTPDYISCSRYHIVSWKKSYHRSMEYKLTKHTLVYLKKCLAAHGIEMWTHREYTNNYHRRIVNILQDSLCPDVARKIVFEHL
jgi:hypothetical protein